jgi:hypothetical protein
MGSEYEFREFPPLDHQTRTAATSVLTENRELPSKRKGHPATGQPFLSRENSSNGGFIHRNFLRESYEP